MHARLRITLASIVAGLVVLGSRPSFATFHLIDLNEVYTNADGTLQFVELVARAAMQTNLGPTNVIAANADSSMTQIVFDFLAPYPVLDAGETVLLATAAFQVAAGFAPDFIIPDGRIFLTHGRVAFDEDVPSANPDVDAVAYGNYTGPNTFFGDPAPPLPSDGFHSLTRINPGNNNSLDFVVLPNSPERNDGTMGQIPPSAAVEPVALSPRAGAFSAAPNPFTRSTRAALELAQAERVRLAVFAADGRLVRELWNGELGPGPRSLEWDRRDAAGRPVAAGAYYLRLVASGETRVAKLTVLP